jgi:Acetyltransferase (GNAT) domain
MSPDSSTVPGAAVILSANERSSVSVKTKETEKSSFAMRTHSAAKEICEINPIQDPRWEVLVDSHPQASVFHSTKWLKALQCVYGYEPVVISSCPVGDRLTNGLVFCRAKSWLTGRRLVSLPFSDHCEPLINRSDELDDMLLRMERYVDEDKWKYVEIRPVSWEPSSHTRFGRVVKHYLHRLNLSLSSEQLFHNFHKDCVQRKIRRAERENLKYEDGASEELLEKFYRLLVMTRRRQGLPPQPLNWFRGLIAAFGNDLKIRVASKNGVAVASILTLSHKKSIVYKYGSSDAAFNSLGGTALLLWKTIQDGIDRGFEELEMGRSEVGNLGLVAFKERWGASRSIISYWTYPPREAGPPSIWKQRLARHVVSTVPDLALKTVGKLLYKHVG